MHRVQTPLDQIVLRASEERELHTAGMGPHEEDESLLGGVLLGHAVLARDAERAERDLGVALGDEVREAFPDEARECVSELLGRHGSGGPELRHGRKGRVFGL